MALPTNFSILKGLVTSPPSAPASKGGLYDNNPYLNQDYYVSPFTSTLSALGFRTGADAWRENMSVQAAEYDAAIAQKLRDEEYNLPVNQVQRMRAAGINPDLEGGADVDPGSAAPMPEDPSTPMQSTGDEEKLFSFGNLVLSSISSALGLVNGVQGVLRNRAENMLSDTRVEEALRSLSKGIFLDSLPAEPFVDDGPDAVRDYRDFAAERAEQLIGKLPKKMRKRMTDYLDSYWNSAPADAESFKVFLEGAKNKKGFFAETSTFYSFYPEMMREIYKDLGSVNERVYKLEQKGAEKSAENDIKEQENRADYLDKVDPELAASAENATNRATTYSKSVDAAIQGAMKDMTATLERHSKKGGLEGMFASSLLVIMAMNQMNMLPSLPSFSRVSGPAGITKSISF